MKRTRRRGTLAAMDRSTGHPVFPSTWWDLYAEERQRRAIANELVAELSPEHPLFGHPGEVIARSEASDDVLLLLEDGRWAIVHLTWRGAPERPPWPVATAYDSAQDVQEALDSE
jgi:hypothetical protein